MADYSEAYQPSPDTSKEQVKKLKQELKKLMEEKDQPNEKETIPAKSVHIANVATGVATTLTNSANTYVNGTKQGGITKYTIRRYKTYNKDGLLESEEVEETYEYGPSIEFGGPVWNTGGIVAKSDFAMQDGG